MVPGGVRMPSIGYFHPQIVHFAIALLFVGVAFRVVSFTPWLTFTGPAARTLVLLGTLATVLAVRSGTDAHDPVERVPGARAAVTDHEEWGERARNAFLFVAAFELFAWGLTRRRAKLARGLTFAAGLAGLAGLAVLYEAAEHGGELVYGYSGGVGIRSGEPSDVQRLLVAGLYHNISRARTEHRAEDAARYVDELVRLRGDDPAMATLRIESLIRDRADARGALAALDSLHPAPDNRRLVLGLGNLRADAYLALGQRDSARIALESLARDFPESTRLTARLDSLR